MTPEERSQAKKSVDYMIASLKEIQGRFPRYTPEWVYSGASVRELGYLSEILGRNAEEDPLTDAARRGAYGDKG